MRFGHTIGSTKPIETEGPAKTTGSSRVWFLPYKRSRSQLQAPTKKLHLPHDHPRRHRRRSGRYRRLRQLQKMKDQCPTERLTGDKVQCSYTSRSHHHLAKAPKAPTWEMPLAQKSPGSQPRQIPRREQTRINIFECLRDAPTSGLATRLAQLNPSEIQGPAKTTTVGLRPSVVSPI